MTDANLLRAYSDERSQAAFAELVNRHGGMVHATARRLAPEDADDVAQAAFLLLARRADDVWQHGNVAGWLHETTRLCAANARRARARRAAHTRAAMEAAVRTASAPATDDALLAHLDDGLGRLSDRYRQVLLLRYMEDLSVDETADRLGLSAAAVMKRSTRALTKLRDFFARRGVTTTAEAVAGCMVLQANQLPEATHVALVATGKGATTGTAAAALAKRVARPMGPVIMAAGGMAALAAACVVIVHTATSPSPAKPAAPIVPAVAPVAPLKPSAAGDPRTAADDFLAGLRDRDVDRVAALLQGTDAEKQRATARQYIATFADGHYVRFPQRLTVQNSMTSTDATGKPMGGTFDAQPPIDAMLGHVAVRVEPLDGGWRIASAEYTDAEAMFSGGRADDLTVAAGKAGFDYGPAAAAWAAMMKDMPGDPAQLTDADVPRLIAATDRFEKGLLDVSSALRGSDIALADADVLRLQSIMASGRKVLRERGIAGYRDLSAQLQKDPQAMRAAAAINGTGAKITARIDAQREANHSAARPPSVEADRQIHSRDGQTVVTIPGPLLFPAWLRETATFKDWQRTHDIRTFTTRDDAGYTYTVAAQGAVRLADGSLHEAIGAIRRYRPDGTLSAVTTWDFGGRGMSGWMTLDATGKQIVWAVRQSGIEQLSPARVTHFDADGSQHWYWIDPPDIIRMEQTADAIGEGEAVVRRQPHR